MENQKLSVFPVVGIIFLSFCGLATQTFEKGEFSYFADGEIGDIVPEWIQEGNLPLIPAIIIFSGLLLFIIFALDLYWKKRKTF